MEMVSYSQRELLYVGQKMSCSWTFRRHSSFFGGNLFVDYYCICGVVVIHDGTRRAGGVESVSCSHEDLLNVGNTMCCSWTFGWHSSCFVYDYVFVEYYCICGVVVIHDGQKASTHIHCMALQCRR